MKYLRKFETTADYESAKDGLIKPNVSYIVEGNDVHYKPIPPMNIIIYEASAKLDETTVQYYSGLHTNAFSGASGQLTITSHTFENGVGTIEFDDDVTRIGERAFNACTSLTSIDIPNSVTSIGSSAFGNCTSLTSITIPDSVTTIEPYTFSTCLGLTSITIPDNVTSIGEMAFDECTSLTSCTIGSSVTSIGDYAFAWCSNLTSIISNAMTAPTIQSNTFKNVKTNGTLTVPSGSSGYDVWMDKLPSNWTKVEQ